MSSLWPNTGEFMELCASADDKAIKDDSAGSVLDKFKDMGYEF